MHDLIVTKLCHHPINSPLGNSLKQACNMKIVHQFGHLETQKNSISWDPLKIFEFCKMF